jgi:hypothetical protein
MALIVRWSPPSRLQQNYPLQLASATFKEVIAVRRI